MSVASISSPFSPVSAPVCFNLFPFNKLKIVINGSCLLQLLLLSLKIVFWRPVAENIQPILKHQCPTLNYAPGFSDHQTLYDPS